MSCKICGRNNCIASFHSLEEQNKHDDPEAYYDNLLTELESDKEELEGDVEKLIDENRKLKEKINQIIIDSHNCDEEEWEEAFAEALTKIKSLVN